MFCTTTQVANLELITSNTDIITRTTVSVLSEYPTEPSAEDIEYIVVDIVSDLFKRYNVPLTVVCVNEIKFIYHSRGVSRDDFASTFTSSFIKLHKIILNTIQVLK